MALFMFGKELKRQFGMFVFVGIESTILNYLIFLLLLEICKINYLFSAGAGFMSGVFFGFIFNKKLSFQSKKSNMRAIPPYLMVYLISLGINLLLLHTLAEFFHFDPTISNLVIAPFIIILNFFGTKLIAFENKEW